MKFGIIAAGEGSRLVSEGFKLPKPLVKINGIPMIERIIRIAKETGFESVSCIINANSPELKKNMTASDYEIPLNLKVLSTPSSMHSLFELREFLNDDSFCLTTADSIFDKNEFSGFVDYGKKNIGRIDGVLAVTKYIDDENPLYVRMNRKRIIEGFGKGQHVTGGIYFFSARIFDLIPKALGLKIERLRNFLQLLLDENFILEGYSFSKIIDVDHKKDIAKAEEFIESANR